MPSIKRQTQEDYDIAEPRASAMIESLRAFGYNIQTAIADLIDNSISAEAKNVWLTFFWKSATHTATTISVTLSQDLKILKRR
ncbi:hypothetical protein [Leptolyngbya sp. Cla-17]|uniref:hypothetical protein n=1 Tax=Leptolyngbya sp. Cla-17 TaxID=2803751 RepID=UPI00181B4479|nr:hypothetical protein [Leptolyngbya sp. Cla-17]